MNIRKVILCKQRLWRLLTFWTILFLSYLPLLLQLQSKHKKKKMAGCIPQKFPSLFFPSVVNTGSTSCSFLLHSLMVLCSKQKASTQEFNFSPHYRILIKMELTGQQLIDAQVRSQSYTLTGFQKQIPPYCHGGLLGIFFFASLGRGEELQK